MKSQSNKRKQSTLNFKQMTRETTATVNDEEVAEIMADACNVNQSGCLTQASNSQHSASQTQSQSYGFVQ